MGVEENHPSKKARAPPAFTLINAIYNSPLALK
jgi:hypothetical protein